MRPTAEHLAAALDHIRAAPRERGTVELIAARPREGERQVLVAGELDLERGLVGDGWFTRKRSAGRARNPNAQVTLMSARAIAAIAGDRSGWPLAGDQLFVELDISVTNLPPGRRLALGTAVLEITADPHTGCSKFTARFGSDATRWVNSPDGRELRLRGVNARVVQAGTVATGDAIRVSTDACPPLSPARSQASR